MDVNGNRTSTPKLSFDRANIKADRRGALKDGQLNEARANGPTKRKIEK